MSDQGEQHTEQSKLDVTEDAGSDRSSACEKSWHNTEGWLGWHDTEGCAEESSDIAPEWYIDSHDLILEPAAAGHHRFTLVLLHSCSGGPDDFISYFHRLCSPFRGHIRAVVPCAPLRWENHYGWGKELNSWFEYDNESEDGNAVKEPAQLQVQRERILKLLEEERQRLPDGNPQRLVIWGLSQGASLAVDVALRAPFAVGGVLALRGMALHYAEDELATCPRGASPVETFAYNGERDWLCPPDTARSTYEALIKYGLKLQFESDPSLAHGCARGRQKMCQQELDRVNAFLKRVWQDL